MGRSFLQIPDGVQWANKYAQQIIASWLGLEGDGTDAQLWGVPLEQTSVKDPDKYAFDARNRVTPGRHYRATHSSGSPVLFEVLDTGAAFGVPPSGVFEIGMIMQWYGAAVDCPAGWAICDGTGGTPDLRDKFVVGAGSTYALSATGGAATVDASHTHTGPAHTHTGPAHTHSGTSSSDGTGATSSDGGGSTSSDGTGSTSSDGTGNTSFDGTGATSTDGAFGLTDGPSNIQSVTDDGTNQTNVADSNHTHHTADHSHTGPSHRHTGPSHTHTGPSHTHSGPAHTHSGPSHNHTLTTNSSGTGATGSDGTEATGTSGSEALAVLPPYAALYYIMRIAA